MQQQQQEVHHLLLILLVSWCVCFSEASEGDESTVFVQCISSCLSTGCTRAPGNRNTCDTCCPNREGSSNSHNSNYRPPWSLRLMRWDCESDCAYHCMWAIETARAAAAEGPVYKYYGKWPFVRVLGAQEIASVVFSIANLLAHAHNLQLYLRFIHRHRLSPSAQQQQQQQRYPYHLLWVAYAAVNINAWVWSSVFHCRDTRLTERLDYFSADLVVVLGCGVVLARMLQLTTLRRLAVLSLLLGSALLQHMYYMSFVKFDYGYNMKLCIALGISTAVAWLVWVTRTRHPGRWIVYKFMGLVHLAMLLEVLDFPPLLRLFDAHALWHAATVPLTYLWYQFIQADVLAAAACQQQQVIGAAAPENNGVVSSHQRKHAA